ncbi:hypothetical protein NMY22_g16918 [Coprinellus aureogranulatus]|nr:hypothetical protein NMY22_g16918 [Coprinellus aureogranulatus]
MWNQAFEWADRDLNTAVSAPPPPGYTHGLMRAQRPRRRPPSPQCLVRTRRREEEGLQGYIPFLHLQHISFVVNAFRLSIQFTTTPGERHRYLQQSNCHSPSNDIFDQQWKPDQILLLLRMRWKPGTWGDALLLHLQEGCPPLLAAVTKAVTVTWSARLHRLQGTASGEDKKKRKKVRKETYSSYIYKGPP